MVSDEQSFMPSGTVRSDEQQNRGNPQPRKACIFRIPPAAYNGNSAAYTPSVLALGPYHVLAESSDNSHTIVTLHDKQMYGEEFLRRCRSSNDQILSVIREFETEIRASYSDKCYGYDSNALMEIMVRDSCFVIEYFRRMFKQGSGEIYTFTKSWDDADLQKDLLLFDNQLPFFILESIYSCSKAINDTGVSFLELTLFYFQGLNIQCLQLGDLSAPPLHFTCMLRSFLIPQSSRRDLGSRVRRKVIGLSSANDLSNAGLNLKTEECTSWLKIDFRRSIFRGSTLTMAQFIVGDQTETLIRNVMELERHYFPDEAYVSDYIFILYFLIQEEGDAKALMDKDIIVHSSRDPTIVVMLVQRLVGYVVDFQTVNTKYNTICVGLKSFQQEKNKKESLKDMCWTTPTRRVVSVLTFAGALLFLYGASRSWQK